MVVCNHVGSIKASNKKKNNKSNNNNNNNNNSTRPSNKYSKKSTTKNLKGCHMEKLCNRTFLIFNPKSSGVDIAAILSPFERWVYVRSNSETYCHNAACFCALGPMNLDLIVK